MTPFTLEFDDLSTAPSSGTLTPATWSATNIALRRLTDSDTGFVILSQNEHSYLQTARTSGPRPEVIIEWQDGSTERHFMFPNTVADPDLLVDLFSKYFHTPDQISSAAPWQAMDL